MTHMPETKELLHFGLVAVKEVRGIFADGTVNLADIDNVYRIAKAALPGVTGIERVLDEVKTAGPMERQDLGEYVESQCAELGIELPPYVKPDDAIEAILILGGMMAGAIAQRVDDKADDTSKANEPQ